MVLLFICFLSGFEWYPLVDNTTGKNLYEAILETDCGHEIIGRYGGKEVLDNRLILIDGGVFEGGAKVLLPKKYKLKKFPDDLKLLKRYINLEKYNRYSAVYKEGELKEVWEKLYKETSEKFRLSSIQELPPEKLRTLNPKLNLARRQGDVEKEKQSRAKNNLSPRLSGRESVSFPSKTFFSFLLIEGVADGSEKLVPVVLELSPIESIVKEILKDKSEGEKR